MFRFGPRLGLQTWGLAQAEQWSELELGWDSWHLRSRVATGSELLKSKVGLREFHSWSWSQNWNLVLLINVRNYWIVFAFLPKRFGRWKTHNIKKANQKHEEPTRDAVDHHSHGGEGEFVLRRHGQLIAHSEIFPQSSTSSIQGWQKMTGTQLPSLLLNQSL